MTTEALEYVSDCLELLNIPFEFLEWKSELTFPYFIGTYTEQQTMNEDGLEEGVFTLTGTTNETFMSLEVIKEEIKHFFPDDGLTTILPNGSGLAVWYDTAFPVPTNTQGLYRIQINLKLKEWKGH